MFLLGTIFNWGSFGKNHAKFQLSVRQTTNNILAFVDQISTHTTITNTGYKSIKYIIFKIKTNQTSRSRMFQM